MSSRVPDRVWHLSRWKSTHRWRGGRKTNACHPPPPRKAPEIGVFAKQRKQRSEQFAVQRYAYIFCLRTRVHSPCHVYTRLWHMAHVFLALDSVNRPRLARPKNVLGRSWRSCEYPFLMEVAGFEWMTPLKHWRGYSYSRPLSSVEALLLGMSRQRPQGVRVSPCFECGSSRRPKKIHCSKLYQEPQVRDVHACIQHARSSHETLGL